jgi:hypothetical protein
MRDDFPESVKAKLAKRAGHRCSNPDCRQPTSGPSLSTTGTVNMGVAAHLTAASPGGARHDPSLTSKERKSYVNGIWLCQYCGSLVDKDEDFYRIELLRAWKHLAEDRAGLDVHRLPPPPLDGTEQIEKEFEAKRSAFHAELASGVFGDLPKRLGILGVIMMPLVQRGDIEFAKFRAELESGFRPIGNGSYDCRLFGDYYECREIIRDSGDGSPYGSVARVYSPGYILAATNDLISWNADDWDVPFDEPLRINDWALNQGLIYGVSHYLKVMEKIRPPYTCLIGISVVGLLHSRLDVNVGITLSEGIPYPGGNIVTPAIKISDRECGQDWDTLAIALKKPLDYIWREFGFDRCLYYSDDGAWIGER